MAKPHTLPLPPDIILWEGCTVRVTALDPLTGNTEAGVTVSNFTMQVEVLSGSAAELGFGPFMFVPGPGA